MMGQSPAAVCTAGSLTFLEPPWPPHPQDIRQADVEITVFINFISGKFRVRVKSASHAL